MYPEIFRIGTLTIHSYGLMIALGILVAAIGIHREAPREGLNADYVLEAVILAAFSGLIGARILYVALNWEYYSARPFSAFFTQFEGLSFYGGLFAGVIALFVWTRWRGIGFLKLADLFAPYLALGYGFGRIGCFLNGCCYGLESTVPWALPVNMADDVLRHPVQLYALLGALIIFVILKLLRPVRPFVGFLLVSLFGLYGLLRFTTEFFRYGEAVLLGLTSAQLFSLALTFFSLLVIAVFFYTAPEEKEEQGQSPRSKKGPKKNKKSIKNEKRQ